MRWMEMVGDGGACSSRRAQETPKSCLYLRWRNCACRMQVAVSFGDAFIFFSLFLVHASFTCQVNKSMTERIFLLRILDIDPREFHALCKKTQNYDHLSVR